MGILEMTGLHIFAYHSWITIPAPSASKNASNASNNSGILEVFQFTLFFRVERHYYSYYGVYIIKILIQNITHHLPERWIEE